MGFCIPYEHIYNERKAMRLRVYHEIMRNETALIEFGLKISGLVGIFKRNKKNLPQGSFYFLAVS